MYHIWYIRRLNVPYVIHLIETYMFFYSNIMRKLDSVVGPSDCKSEASALGVRFSPSVPNNSC